MVSDQAIVKRLHQLLAVSDLNVTTEKHIRLQLEAEFDLDLSERKKFLREEIQNYLNNRPAEPEVRASTKRKTKEKKEKKSKKRPDSETPAG